MSGLHIYQFVGLVRLVDHAVDRAEPLDSPDRWFHYHVLLAAYAALEALVLETAIDCAPDLYNSKRGAFRTKGLTDKWRLYLDARGRQTDEVPDTVLRVSAYRIAVTHSEPDSNRISAVNNAINNGQILTLARSIRAQATWLWRGEVPRPAQELFNH